MTDPLQYILNERASQDKKWGANRNLPDSKWLTILMEEVGEVSKEMLEHRSPKPELVQVAAVALAWLENLERNDTQPTKT